MNDGTSQAKMKWAELCDESFLVMVLESIYDALVVVDSAGKIVYVNPAYTRELKVEFDNIVGKRIQDVAPESVIMKVLETGKPEIGVASTILKLGIDIIVNSTPIYKNNVLSGVVSVFKNVTEIKNLGDQLEKMKDYRDYLQQQLYLKTGLPEEFAGIIGNNTNFRKLLSRAMMAARSDITVLLQGETGTGKDLIASAIHNASKRKGQPLIEVNCTAIPETLLESELFGYEGGAFTGARKGGKPGKFELAEKGTLFLDEIGDMSVMLQSKLLRVLQQKKIERIGGTKSFNLDVRIITATNQNLNMLVKENKFRADLYYRLNVFSIDMIPLRERKDDIPILSYYFLKKYNEREKKRCKLTPPVLNLFMKYRWPGNIRELMNILESAVVSCNGRIEIKHLPAYFTAMMSIDDEFETGENDSSLNLDKRIHGIEKDFIVKALRIAQHNKSRAIELLGISRSAFYDKVKKYEIKLDLDQQGEE